MAVVRSSDPPEFAQEHFMGSPAHNRILAKRRQRLTPQRAERIAVALDLRSEGLTYRDIAAQLQTSPSQARRMVQRGIQEMIREPAEELRAIEERRLDALWRAAWRQLHMPHLKVSHGQVVMDQEGEPVIDEAAKLAALDRCLKVADRRAHLLGLDAPKRTEHITMDAVDAEIQRLTEELGRNDPVVRIEIEEEEDAPVG